MGAPDSSPGGLPKPGPEAQSPITADTSKERGGRLKALAKRFATKITSLRQKKAADQVLKDLVKRPENKGADLSKNVAEQAVTVDKSEDWRDAIKGIRKNKLKRNVRKWAKAHAEQVDTQLKKIDGYDNPGNTRRQNFENLTKAVTNARQEADQKLAASRKEKGQTLIDRVANIQNSDTYKNAVRDERLKQTGENGRQLKLREEARIRRDLLRKQYDSLYPRQDTSGTQPARNGIPEPISSGTGEAGQAQMDTSAAPDSPADEQDILNSSDAPREQAAAERTAGEASSATTGTEAAAGPEKTPRESADEITAKLKTLGLNIEDPQVEELVNSLRENLGAGPDVMKSLEHVAQAVKAASEALGITFTPGQTAEHAKLELKTVAENVQQQHTDALAAAKGDESDPEVQNKRKHLGILMTILRALGITAIAAATVVAGVVVAEGAVVRGVASAAGRG